MGRLREAVRTVLGDPSYRARARRLQSSIEAADGLNRAADLVEGAFDRGAPYRAGRPEPAAAPGGGRDG